MDSSRPTATVQTREGSDGDPRTYASLDPGDFALVDPSYDPDCRLAEATRNSGDVKLVPHREKEAAGSLISQGQSALDCRHGNILRPATHPRLIG